MVNSEPGPLWSGDAHGRGNSRREQVADQIKQLIIRNRMRPGDLLPTEGELCDVLHASRSSVREAVKMLNALDIVEVRHGHGTYVGGMSLGPLVESLTFRGFLSRDDDHRVMSELVDVRDTLEQGFAESIVEALTDEQGERLATTADKMLTRARAGQEFIDLDRDFHLALMQELGNQLLLQLTGAFWEVHAAAAPTLGHAAGQLEETAIAHVRIAEAVRAKDVPAVREAIAAHYVPIRSTIAQFHRRA
ncbi:MAG: FadR/GntR family transcriptional regulator [Nocardioides sp.]|uniref:FadR/GntR family transcriptional regulator n=1 Tax=Nocardioides sp. TaxID=35761 RepID=UPI003F12A81A